MRLIFLGPPGIGKGTQAKIVAKLFSIPHLSSGEILREQISSHTKLGHEIKELIESGHLIPDETMLDVMRERMANPDAFRGFILDGFPRTVPQAIGFNHLMKEMDKQLDAVIFLDGDEKELVDRITNRRECNNCNTITNLITNPPQMNNLCDHCGGSLVQRADDTAEVVKNRLKIYWDKTAPLVIHYEKLGMLHRVSGMKPIEEVTGLILEEIQRYA